jgi:hypothetical protein
MRTGGCQCGAVRFEVRRDRLIAYACHCRECQRQSASAFGISVPVRRDQFEITGRVGVWTRVTDSGVRSDCAFCAECGTRLFHAPAVGGEFVTAKGGAFGDTSDLAPVAHLWISRKLPWVILQDDIPTFDTQPGDMRAWRLGLLNAPK